MVNCFGSNTEGPLSNLSLKSDNMTDPLVVLTHSFKEYFKVQ
jgi:hypothetical protein